MPFLVLETFPVPVLSLPAFIPILCLSLSQTYSHGISQSNSIPVSTVGLTLGIYAIPSSRSAF